MLTVKRRPEPFRVDELVKADETERLTIGRDVRVGRAGACPCSEPPLVAAVKLHAPNDVFAGVCVEPFEHNPPSVGRGKTVHPRRGCALRGGG